MSVSTTGTEIAEKLQKALDLLGPNGENWIKGDYRRGKKRCGLGACYDAGFEGSEAGMILYQFTPDGEVFWTFQDKPETTFAQVREVFKKAIEAAKS